MKNSAMTTICKQLLIWLASLHMTVGSASAYVAISNVVARQRSGTQLVDITYDLHADHSSARVGVAVHHGSFDPVEASSFSGDGYGDAVVPGEGKRIVWNAGADMEPFAPPDLYLRIQATTRFVVHGDVVEDRSTGLMWTKDVTMGQMKWYDAWAFCTNLVYGGYNDWKLVDDVRHSPVFEHLSESAIPFENINTNLGYWGKCMFPTIGAPFFIPGRSTQPGILININYSLGVWPVRGEPVLVNETFEALSDSVHIDYDSGPVPLISIEYLAGTGGMICGPAQQQIAVGGEGEVVAALPDPEHRFVRWSDHSTDNPRRDQNVSSNMTLRAEFMPRAAAVSRPRSDSSFTTTLSSSGAMGCSGLMSVDIAVDRVVGEIPKLVSSGAMGRTAELRIMGYSPGSNTYAVLWTGTGPEIKVGEVQLDGTWRVVRLAVPVEHIDFPADPGEGRSPTPAVNRLRLEPVGANENVAALTVSEVELKIEVAPPIFFVHGILSKGNTWQAMRKFVADELGLPTDTITMPDVLKLASMEVNAGHIRDRIQMLKQRWGVDRVNIVAHSKGGLDAKHYVMGPGFQDDVMHLIQIATPNGGSPTADKLRLLADAASLILPWPTEAGRQLRTDYMSAYNRVWQERFRMSPVNIKTIAGDYRVPDTFGDLLASWDCGGYRDETAPGQLCPAPWDNNEGRSLHSYCEKYGYALWLCDQYRADSSPYHVDEYVQYVQPNDLYVPVWSAYALGTAYPPGTARMSAGTDDSMSHVNIHQQREIFDLIKADLVKRHDPDQAASRVKGKFLSARSEGKQWKERHAKDVRPAADRDDLPGYAYYGVLPPQGEAAYEFLVAAGNVVAFQAAGFRGYGEPAPHGDLHWSFINPTGTTWTNSDSADGVHFEWTAEGGGPLRVMLDRPAAGAWTVRVHNASQTWTNAIRLEMTGLDDGVEVSAQLDEDRIPFGQPVVGRVELMREGLPVTGARVTGLIYDSESDAEFPIAALDDGAGADEVAGDGVYTVAFMPEEDGVYDVALSVRSDAEPVFMRRLRPLRALVAEPGAAILGVQEEAVQDADADGLHDQLILHLEVDVARAGRLHVSGNLLDAQGLVVAHAHEVVETLSGVQAVSLAFDGRQIYWSGEDGPYVLSDVRMTREYPSSELIVLVETTDVYETAAYSHREFEHGPFPQIGEADFEAVDTDADGLYDRLEVAMEMDAWDSLAGEYQWRAELVDGTGRRIAGVEGSCALGQDEDGRVILEIDGTVIGAAGINGPYHLVNLEFWQAGQLHIVFNPAGSSSFLPASGFNGYVPFPQETMDISVEHRADSFVLRWGSTTGVWYDIEYVPDPQDGGGEPLPHGMGIPANPPLNVWTQSWAGPSNHWYHYQVRPRRIP